MVVLGKPPKSSRRRALQDQRGKWTAIPKPRAQTDDDIPAVATGEQVQVPQQQQAKTHYGDSHLRWLLITRTLSLCASTKKAAFTIAIHCLEKLALAKATRRQSKAHSAQIKERDRIEDALYTEIDCLEEALSQS